MSIFVETPFDQELVDMLRGTVQPGQYAARNAVRHIDKAAAIATADPEMAAFRAITAEEESATALFHALRRHDYPGSKALKPHNHLQKNAVSPFCAAVAELFAYADERLHVRPELSIVDEQGAKRLITQFHVGGLGLGDRLAKPHPPLNLEIRRNERLHDFSEQLDRLAESRHFDSIRAHLLARANLRNEILYASSTGLPSVKLNNFLREQRQTVKNIVMLFLLIDPYPEHQLFVSQALRSFLKMIDKLPDDLAF
jgi:hypothetical protein